jgi:predicted porin
MKGTTRVLAVAVGLVELALIPIVYAGPTVYGQLNLSLDNLDNGADSAFNVSSNSSRLGVKGDIQVGDNLAGIYQVESEINADTGSASSNNTVFASRDTFAGLQGNFGTVRVGRFDTPVKLLGRQVDLFKDQVGDARNLTRGANGSGTTNTLARFDERPNNSIGYISPTISGFTGLLQYATNTDSGTTSNDTNKLISVAANYAQGPLFAGIGYEKDGYLSTTVPPVAGRDPSVVRLAGYYDIAAWRINGLWQTVSGTTSNNDEDVYGVGVRYVNDVWTYKTQTYQLKSNGPNKDATLFAIGAEYVLQKGITLYADYATLDNDSQQKLTPYKEGRSDNLAVTTAGNTASGISLGTIIKF